MRREPARRTRRDRVVLEVEDRGSWRTFNPKGGRFPLDHFNYGIYVGLSEVCVLRADGVEPESDHHLILIFFGSSGVFFQILPGVTIHFHPGTD